MIVSMSEQGADHFMQAKTYPAPAAVLELLKPITWFPPMWAFACGVLASGAPLLENAVIAIVGVSDEGKAAIAVAVTADLVGRVSAAELVKAAVPAMGGQGGGGKPDFAQGGAPDGSLAEAGLAAIRTALGG